MYLKTILRQDITYLGWRVANASIDIVNFYLEHTLKIFPQLREKGKQETPLTQRPLEKTKLLCGRVKKSKGIDLGVLAEAYSSGYVRRIGWSSHGVVGL
ncbi:hypothetical protein FRX31_007463 [Thalictrum thalictroides]|uniref:Uncharacterized protein n=1 Tax=Thalictrum thalictroides TaxID=46969 RepID=A0A7J6WZQ6_THATH|nr:hypothetical protein FRX31_007463 [Thalictrum thalictroides]